MDDIKNLTLRLPTPLNDQLRQIAERERRSVNTLVVLVLESFVTEYTAKIGPDEESLGRTPGYDAPGVKGGTAGKPPSRQPGYDTPEVTAAA